jgi:hypothetical protein
VIFAGYECKAKVGLTVEIANGWSAIRQLKLESAKPASNVHVARHSALYVETTHRIRKPFQTTADLTETDVF